LAAAGLADRRNGTYRRQLLTMLGVIELAVPRSRTFGPTAVIRAYAQANRRPCRPDLAPHNPRQHPGRAYRRRTASCGKKP